MKLCTKDFKLSTVPTSSLKLVSERKSQDLLLVLEILNLMYSTLLHSKLIENRLWEKPGLTF